MDGLFSKKWKITNDRICKPRKYLAPKRVKYEYASDLAVIHIGIDFNIGGCCANAFVIEVNEPIAVDEFSSYDTRDFINNLERYKGKKVIVYPDARRW